MQPQLELDYTIYTLAQLKEFESGDTILPQIAMAGRSNVGKSSLINALANRKDLAKTSSSPGKTRSLNFFRVKPQDYYLVDLPGYGYARCSKTEREKWAKLIDAYLTRTPGLSAVVLLIDSRIPPQDLDRDLAGFVQGAGIPLVPVLTKIDKCSTKDRALREKEWKAILGLGKMQLVSAKTGSGLEKLWQLMHAAALGEETTANEQNPA